VASLEVIFSASSPIAFGGLADEYVSRIERMHPAGSSSNNAMNAMSDDGLKFSVPMSACGRVKPCYAWALMYAGGNPLCSYWHGIMIETNGWDGSAIIRGWVRLPNQITCFWSGYRASGGRPAVLIDSLRAELGIR
jgi:hypothetical protein